MPNSCPDRYKTLEMCEKVIDSYIVALKFVSNWFVNSTTYPYIDCYTYNNTHNDSDNDDDDHNYEH